VDHIYLKALQLTHLFSLNVFILILCFHCFFLVSASSFVQTHFLC